MKETKSNFYEKPTRHSDWATLLGVFSARPFEMVDKDTLATKTGIDIYGDNGDGALRVAITEARARLPDHAKILNAEKAYVFVEKQNIDTTFVAKGFRPVPGWVLRGDDPWLTALFVAMRTLRVTSDSSAKPLLEAQQHRFVSTLIRHHGLVTPVAQKIFIEEFQIPYTVVHVTVNRVRNFLSDNKLRWELNRGSGGYMLVPLKKTK